MKTKIIDLGMHPYADTFISKDQLNLSEPVYPLQCYLDPTNSLISLGVKTNDDERYNLYDYSYTSSNSEFSKKYWESYYRDIINNKIISKDSKILEVGSNDGYLLSIFQQNGFVVLGFDSSKKMADLANKNNIKTIHSLFTKSNVQILKNKFDLIIANNVFNHSNDPFDFLIGVKNSLSNNGIFVFEVPYWLDTIKDFRFDQIYHEHVSYFTVKSAKNFLTQAGLNIFKVEKTNYHGGSIRVYSSIKDSTKSNDIEKFIKQEDNLKLFEPNSYQKYMNEINKRKLNIMHKIYSLKKLNKSIVAVGAAAKGNTLLNYYGLNNGLIDYVTDNSEYKKGKYTPLTRIPIESDEYVFSKYNEVYALILSWNLSPILKTKLKTINNNIKFLNLSL